MIIYIQHVPMQFVSLYELIWLNLFSSDNRYSIITHGILDFRTKKIYFKYYQLHNIWPVHYYVLYFLVYMEV